MYCGGGDKLYLVIFKDLIEQIKRMKHARKNSIRSESYYFWKSGIVGYYYRDCGILQIKCANLESGYFKEQRIVHSFGQYQFKFGKYIISVELHDF